MKIYKILSIIFVLLLLGFLIKVFLFNKNNDKNYEKGVEYFNKKEYENAIAYFKISKNPEDVKILKALAAVYLETNNYNEAQNYLLKALKNTSEQANDYKFILNDLGVCSFKLNDFKSAREYWNKSQKAGNIDSEENLKKLDSLEMSLK